jgi:hypothetical protein
MFLKKAIESDDNCKIFLGVGEHYINNCAQLSVVGLKNPKSHQWSNMHSKFDRLLYIFGLADCRHTFIKGIVADPNNINNIGSQDPLYVMFSYTPNQHQVNSNKFFLYDKTELELQPNFLDYMLQCIKMESDIHYEKYNTIVGFNFNLIYLYMIPNEILNYDNNVDLQLKKEAKNIYKYVQFETDNNIININTANRLISDRNNFNKLIEISRGNKPEKRCKFNYGGDRRSLFFREQKGYIKPMDCIVVGEALSMVSNFEIQIDPYIQTLMDIDEMNKAITKKYDEQIKLITGVRITWEDLLKIKYVMRNSFDMDYYLLLIKRALPKNDSMYIKFALKMFNGRFNFRQYENEPWSSEYQPIIRIDNNNNIYVIRKYLDHIYSIWYDRQIKKLVAAGINCEKYLTKKHATAGLKAIPTVGQYFQGFKECKRGTDRDNYVFIIPYYCLNDNSFEIFDFKHKFNTIQQWYEASQIASNNS